MRPMILLVTVLSVLHFICFSKLFVACGETPVASMTSPGVQDMSEDAGKDSLATAWYDAGTSTSTCRKNKTEAHHHMPTILTLFR